MISARNPVAADSASASAVGNFVESGRLSTKDRNITVWGKALLTWGLLVAVIMSGTGCRDHEQSKVDADVLARVGTTEIRTKDLVAEIERRQRLVHDNADREALLEDLITRQAMVARALHLGLDQDPKVRRNYENLLIGELKARELEPGIRALEVTAADLKLASEPQPASAVRSGPVSEFAILSSLARNRPSPQKRAQMVERLTEARQRALQLPAAIRDFSELAIDYSDDQASRYRGGQVGWFDHAPAKYRFPIEVLEAGFQLRSPGEISNVIETTNGVFLVRLMARRSAGEPAPASDETLLRQKILAQKQSEAQAEFIRATRSTISIRAFPERLHQVPAATPGLAASNETPLPQAL